MECSETKKKEKTGIGKAIDAFSDSKNEKSSAGFEEGMDSTFLSCKFQIYLVSWLEINLFLESMGAASLFIVMKYTLLCKLDYILYKGIYR